MRSPRCGVPDVVAHSGEGSGATGSSGHSIPDTDHPQPQAFTALGSRWRKDTVSWKPVSLTNKLRPDLQDAAFRQALELWSRQIPLKFRKTSGDPDMVLKFARGEHGDGYHNRFDGPGRVLAHAYGPGEGIAGDTHFDDDEDWTLGTGQGTDLTTVAAHEFGHALGLGHSSVPDALMAPYYVYKPTLRLHRDDITGIQRLYGPRVNPTTPDIATTTSTTTTTTTTPETTPTTTTTTPTTTPTTTTSSTTIRTTTTSRSTTQETSGTTTTEHTSIAPPPAFCGRSFRLDAITEGPDGYFYAFRWSKVFKVGQRGLEPGFPKEISQVFPGAPKMHIGAATFVPSNGKIYIFQGYYVWRFTGFQLDGGYPRLSHQAGSPVLVPKAAFTYTYGGVSRVFLFTENYFWEWDMLREKMAAGYPLSSRTYFRHIPYNPDALYMNTQGNFFAFKWNTMRKMEHRGSAAEVFSIGTALFGPVCDQKQDGGQTSGLVTLKPPASDMAPAALEEAPESDDTNSAAVQRGQRQLSDISGFSTKVFSKNSDILQTPNTDFNSMEEFLAWPKGRGPSLVSSTFQHKIKRHKIKRRLGKFNNFYRRFGGKRRWF